MPSPTDRKGKRGSICLKSNATDAGNGATTNQTAPSHPGSEASGPKHLGSPRLLGRCRPEEDPHQVGRCPKLKAKTKGNGQPQQDDSDDEPPEEMNVEQDGHEDQENEPPQAQPRSTLARTKGLKQATGGNQANLQPLPKIRVSKTGKVQALVTDEPPKLPDPI
ncbi:MAG: hypothetical protein Q9220_007753 [cf. Caloplaca sp. 1 TL-2023]